MPFSNVRRDRTHIGNSIPHELRIVDRIEATWQLNKHSSFNDTARAWATIGVDPEVVSYAAPLANVHDEQHAAIGLNELRRHLSPKKTPIADRQAVIEQQLADAAPQTPGTPEIATKTASLPSSDNAEQAMEEETDKDQVMQGYRNLIKLQTLNKANGQIVAHLRKIFAAQTPEFRANATILGNSETTLEPSMFEANPVAFRAEMLRIFNLTYLEDDRIEDLRSRICNITYTSMAKLIGMTTHIEALSRDIANFPAQADALQKLLNRTIWIKLQRAPEKQIEAIALIIDSGAITLQQTHARLVKLHVEMEMHGHYKTIRANNAMTGLKPGQGRAPDGTYCEACKHNFGREYQHSTSRCKASPKRQSEENKQWFERMWRDTNESGTSKKPYVFEDIIESPTKRTKFGL